ncbi:MAG TPA: hypothetical protein VGP61_06955, partial [Gemmatimonadales bacterium]|nr:hypothetical protein [Gemmatimonadales bacterium]
GAARAARESGDSGKALTYYRELLQLGTHANGPLRPELAEAARVVARASATPAHRPADRGRSAR